MREEEDEMEQELLHNTKLLHLVGHQLLLLFSVSVSSSSGYCIMLSVDGASSSVTNNTNSEQQELLINDLRDQIDSSQSTIQELRLQVDHLNMIIDTDLYLLILLCN